MIRMVLIGWNMPANNNKRKRMRLNWTTMALVVVLILPYVGLFYVWKYYNRQIREIPNASFVLISKEDMMLRQYDYKGNILCEYPIAVGKNYGAKRSVGDMKTPEGIFTIEDIQDASGWDHDFGDGKGPVQGAYGDFFIRLRTPGHKGIGIHGTHVPESIGSRATEGCIRLSNENLNEFVKGIHPAMVVVIEPSRLDVMADSDTSLVKL